MRAPPHSSSSYSAFVTHARRFVRLRERSHGPMAKTGRRTLSGAAFQRFLYFSRPDSWPSSFTSSSAIVVAQYWPAYGLWYGYSTYNKFDGSTFNRRVVQNRPNYQEVGRLGPPTVVQQDVSVYRSLRCFTVISFIPVSAAHRIS